MDRTGLYFILVFIYKRRYQIKRCLLLDTVSKKNQSNTIAIHVTAKSATDLIASRYYIVVISVGDDTAAKWYI